MDLKQSGNLLFVVGETHDELGGSHFNLVHGLQGGTVPQPTPGTIGTMRRLYNAIQGGLVQSCHDVSEGGIGVALAEMCIAGRLGARIELVELAERCGFSDAATLLFSESTGRFIVEVSPQEADQLTETVGNTICQRIGEVCDDQILRIASEITDNPVIDIAIHVLETAWRGEQLSRPVNDKPPATMSPRFRRRTSIARITPPRALILRANGTNRDREAALACELAGALPEIVHVNQLLNGERRLLDFHLLVVPGGFSYGDDLGAGRLWALDLRERLGSDLARFISEGRPVLGICNGFQALVKAGVLPGQDWMRDGGCCVTLTRNESAHFECRWVYLQAQAHSSCLFTEGLDEPIYCPVAHGEGRLVTADRPTLEALWSAGLAALTYAHKDGTPGAYPANPNGSSWGIAGLSNRDGNVFGLMPHPEDHIFPWQHPRWRCGEQGMDGLKLFKNGVKYA
jgi:phosphoribosylformylglycinamidine synthase